MQTEIITMNQAKAAVIYSEECILKDAQSALDFIMSIKYETDCERIVLNKKAIAEEFSFSAQAGRRNLAEVYKLWDKVRGLRRFFQIYKQAPEGFHIRE